MQKYKYHSAFTDTYVILTTIFIQSYIEIQ